MFLRVDTQQVPGKKKRSASSRVISAHSLPFQISMQLKLGELAKGRDIEISLADCEASCRSAVGNIVAAHTL